MNIFQYLFMDKPCFPEYYDNAWTHNGTCIYTFKYILIVLLTCLTHLACTLFIIGYKRRIFNIRLNLTCSILNILNAQNIRKKQHEQYMVITLADIMSNVGFNIPAYILLYEFFI